VVKVPEQLAEVELEAIRQQLETAVHEAETDDPKELRRQVRELRAQLGRQQPREVVKTKEVVKTVEVPVLRHDELARLEDVADSLTKMAGEILEAVSHVAQRSSTMAAELKKPADQPPEVPTAPIPSIGGQPNNELIDGWRSRLSEGERRVLDALLKVHPMPLTKAEVALRSRYSVRSSSYEVYLARLKRVGLIAFDGKHYLASASLFSSKSAA
jgi:hypothetical protein